MPALPDVPNVIRLDLIHSEAGDPGLGNRSFWRYTGGAPSITDLDTFCTGAAAAWNTNIAPLSATAVVLKEIVATDLTSPTGSRGTWTGTHAGTRSGDGLPMDACLLLNFTIDRRYRGGKPRTYNPWGTSTDLATERTWETTFLTDVTTGWGTFAGDIGAAVIGPASIDAQVNVSYYKGFLPVQNPVTLRWRNIPTARAAALVDVIASFSPNPLVGSQRRRIRA